MTTVSLTTWNFGMWNMSFGAIKDKNEYLTVVVFRFFSDSFGFVSCTAEVHQ